MQTETRQLSEHLCALLASGHDLIAAVRANNPPRLVTPLTQRQDLALRLFARAVDECEAWLRLQAHRQQLPYECGPSPLAAIDNPMLEVEHAQAG